MMQEKVGHEGRIVHARLFKPIENVGGDDFGVPAELTKAIKGLRCDEIDAVNKHDLEGAGSWGERAGAFEEKRTIARPEIEDGIDPAVGMVLAPGVHEQGDMAHDSIDAAEVFARTDRAAIIRRQLVEPL